MRGLFVGSDPPWPVESGHAQRMVHTILGLSMVVDVEVVTLFDPWQDRGGVAPDVVSTWTQLRRPPAPSPLVRYLASARPYSLPRALAGRQVGAVRAELAGAVRPDYDLIWVERVEPMWFLGPGLPAGPVVLDFVDLEDAKAAARARMLRQSADGMRSTLGAQVRSALARRDTRAWARLQRRAAASAAGVVLVSRLDMQRFTGFGGPKFVIPNGGSLPVGCPNPLPDPSQRRLPASVPAPVVLFHGSLTYPPNGDAARVLVREVGPRLWQSQPDATIRLVGKASEALSRLHDPPRVQVTGWVDDLTAELQGADVVVVPIRYGGGTRIKILDAWAHRVPVVSTTIGAEGLDAKDGVELLIADSPREMADACVRLFNDHTLHKSLTEAGYERFSRHHQWRSIEEQVARVAANVISGGV